MVSKNIVLVHGWGADVEKLAPLSRSFKKEGWNVFVPKLPGFDLVSPRVAWGTGEYAEYVWEKAQKHFSGGRFFLFGHSFGGRIVIKLAAKYQKGLPGIVLCATGGISRANPVKRGIFFVLAKMGKIFLVLPAVSGIWQTVLYKLAREHDYEKAKGIMREVFKKVVSKNALQDLQEISIPTLVLWGRKDRMTKVEDAYEITKKVKGSELFVFENEGHRLPYREPDRVVEQINTWAKKIH
ncbi:MAG: alpha/beta hydrolase [Candidatus Blackburnbacteria bacterium]|nr:alpha/beta hydrolase [Candidatus Blackburnbacteria bacterium]